MRKLIFGVAVPIAILGAAGAAVAVLSATKPEPEKKDEITRRASLFVDRVEAQPLTLTVRSQGEVRPRTEIDLLPQVGGRVIAVSPAFVSGGRVAPDQVLIKLDDADYQLELVRAQSRLAQAERVLAEELARAGINRKQWNWQEMQDTDRPTGLALREPHVAEAEANARAALAEVEFARRQIDRTELAVPFDGRVRSMAVGVGQFVAPGTPLGRVFDTGLVEVRLPLTDDQIGMLDLPIGYTAEPGQGRRVDLVARVAGAERRWQARLVRIDGAIDAETRLLYGIAEVHDPYGRGAIDGVPLPVGLFVQAEIEGRRLDTALVMPRTALRGKDKAYVVNGKGELEIRTVKVLFSDDERAVVAGGVADGERVVISPVRGAYDGMPVEVLESVELTQRLAQLN